MNRKGLTEVELNKVLEAAGYVAVRRCLKGGTGLCRFKEWTGRSWIDFTNPDNVQHLMKRLAILQRLHEGKSLTFEQVKSALTMNQGFDADGIDGNNVAPIPSKHNDPSAMIPLISSPQTNFHAQQL